jgi:hypothetical protein
MLADGRVEMEISRQRLGYVFKVAFKRSSSERAVTRRAAAREVERAMVEVQSRESRARFRRSPFEKFVTSLATPA